MLHSQLISPFLLPSEHVSLHKLQSYRFPWTNPSNPEDATTNTATISSNSTVVTTSTLVKAFNDKGRRLEYAEDMCYSSWGQCEVLRTRKLHLSPQERYTEVSHLIRSIFQSWWRQCWTSMVLIPELPKRTEGTRGRARVSWTAVKGKA